VFDVDVKVNHDPEIGKERLTMTTYSISDLAREFDVTTRTIRFYEDEGLISPTREGRRRIFSPRDRTRLKLILRGKRIGFSLAEIREIIDMYDATPGEAGQLRLLVERIEVQRRELVARRADIDRTLDDLADVENHARRRLDELES
jgi:DNA-binding transcriptional MerR regulator